MVQEPAGLTVPRSPSSPAGTRPPPARRCPGAAKTSAARTSAARTSASKAGAARISGPDVTGPGIRREADHGLAHRRPGPTDRRAIRPLRRRLPGHDHRAGAGLRRLEHRGQPVTVGYEPDMLPPGAAGQLLCPWPNRVEGGHYDIDGTHYQLDLSEPANGNAIHGLTRWSSWTPGPDSAPGRGGGHPPARAARPPGIPVRPGTGRVVPAGWRARAAGQRQRAQPGLRRGPVRDRVASVPDRRGGHGGRVRPQRPGRAVAAGRGAGHPDRDPRRRDRHRVRFPRTAAHRRHPA